MHSIKLNSFPQNRFNGIWSSKRPPASECVTYAINLSQSATHLGFCFGPEDLGAGLGAGSAGGAQEDVSNDAILSFRSPISSIFTILKI